jgi:hypothetical protein
MQGDAERQLKSAGGLTEPVDSDDDAFNSVRSVTMERTLVTWLGLSLAERQLFLIKSGMFLSVCGATLFVALASSYPAVHDTLHNVRHALAVVPCH